MFSMCCSSSSHDSDLCTISTCIKHINLPINGMCDGWCTHMSQVLVCVGFLLRLMENCAWSIVCAGNHRHGGSWSLWDDIGHTFEQDLHEFEAFFKERGMSGEKAPSLMWRTRVSNACAESSRRRRWCRISCTFCGILVVMHRVMELPCFIIWGATASICTGTFYTDYTLVRKRSSQATVKMYVCGAWRLRSLVERWRRRQMRWRRHGLAEMDRLDEFWRGNCRVVLWIDCVYQAVHCSRCVRKLC